MAKIIGIVGSRHRDAPEDFGKVLDAFLNIYEKGDWICSGGCSQGGDRFAVELHKRFCTPYLEFPADWEEFGKTAGHVRNRDIAMASNVLIACVSEDRTGGTESTIEKFKRIHPDRKVIIV